MSHAIFGTVCAIVIGIFFWSAGKGFFESASPSPQDSYYNLLVQGFRSGQLNLKREPPPGLAKLANPYDPAANASSVWDPRHLLYEMSYYKGKLYLYYGVTPALVLFWPYAALTGHYCPHKDAVVIFFASGFLITALLLYGIWRKYFADVSIWVVVAGMLALGLTTGVLGSLSNCDLHEVPHSCGFAFTMLALAAVWGALHESKWQFLWLILGSLAYGLAIGSRPSLLFGSIILLVPVVHRWYATKPASLQRIGLLFLAAMGPMMLVGLGLMLYNTRRFDSPFEFGWRYQLTDIQNNAARPFSSHYLWFNFRLYFLEPIRWGFHFPFLQFGRVPPLPSRYYGVGETYCGIFINYPLVWLAFAAPLAWRNRSISETSALRWFVGAAFLLFATCALTLCAFFSGSSGYLSDFLPALMVLAVLGVWGLERALAGSPFWQRIARGCWCLLLAYSLVFSILASIKTHAQADYILGNSLSHQGRDEAVDYYQKAVALDPESATFHLGLGKAYIKKGRVDEAIVHFERALELEPANVEAQYDCGLSLIQAGRLDKAIFHLQKVLEIGPAFAETQDPVVNNNFAWFLATNPESGNRNGQIAVMLAEAACRKTHYHVTIMVGTLGAAYAEAGRFDDAIAAARRACWMASQSGDRKLLQGNQDLLALYLNHQPYRENQANVSK